jgi:hypothetical protein
MSDVANQCPCRGCSVALRGGAPLCKNHWASVPSELKSAIYQEQRHVHGSTPSKEWFAAVAAAVEHVANIVKIKGYEEHGSYPSPQAAICSVCFKLAWLCPHDWSLRLPQDKWESVARGVPMPERKEK